MNDLEFKQQVLDPKGTFCAAKWYNATIWLGSGMTTSCHHPLPHKVEVDDVMRNPKALHNTQKKKMEREQIEEAFLNGEFQQITLNVYEESGEQLNTLITPYGYYVKKYGGDK